MACNLREFSNFMPLFGVSRKKLCGTEQKLKGFKNHETSAQKLSLMSNIQSPDLLLTERTSPLDSRRSNPELKNNSNPFSKIKIKDHEYKDLASHNFILAAPGP